MVDIVGVFRQEVGEGIVGGLQYHTAFYQLPQGEGGDCITSHQYTDAVIVDDIPGVVVRCLLISAGIGKNQVCLASLERLDGITPFLEQELAGDSQLFHDSTHDIYVRACRLSFVVLVFVGWLVPVSGYDDGMLLIELPLIRPLGVYGKTDYQQYCQCEILKNVSVLSHIRCISYV